MVVLNAFCPLPLGLLLHPVLSTGDTAILDSEDEDQSLGKPVCCRGPSP